MNWVLAIDIGNSSVVAAVATFADSAIGDSAAGDATTSIVSLDSASGTRQDWMPAAVFLTGDTVYTGQQAISHAAEAPSAFARSPKRFIGSDNLRARELFATIIEQVRRTAMVHVADAIGTHMGKVAEYPTKLVLTHPAAWPSSARQVLSDAAIAAGFPSSTVTLVSEPIAASYSLPRKYRSGNLLVLDVGGGTCDVAVVDMEGSSPRVLADGGENAIGGNNFDLAVMEIMEAMVLDEFGELPEEISSGTGRATFEAQAKRVRENLSEAPDASFVVAGEEFLLTRNQFEHAIAGDIDRIRTLISNKVQVLGEKKNLLSALLVGGTAQTPAIAAVVQQHMEVLPIENPISAVALGAAAFGANEVSKEASEQAAAVTAAGLARVQKHHGDSTEAVSTTSKKTGVSRKTATRIGAVIAGLVIAAGVFYFVDGPVGDDDNSAHPPAAQQNAAGVGQLHTYPNVNIGSLKATVISNNAPAFKDGFLSCEPMVDAAAASFKAIDGFPDDESMISGFSGTSECHFYDGDLDSENYVEISTYSPAGKSVSSDAKPADDPRIAHWYEVAPDSLMEKAEIVVYVKDFGWISVESPSEELFNNHVLHDVAAVLDAQLQLRKA